MSGAHLKANARTLIINNAPMLFFVALVYLVMIIILSELSYRLPGRIDIPGMYERMALGEIPGLTMIYSDFRPAGALLALLLNLFRPVIDTGFVSYCMKKLRGQDAGFKELFDGFQLFIKCICIFIITTVFIFLWSLLLIIPGIVAAYKYRLAYYILLDDPGKGALACITESAAMMNGAKVDLLIIDLSFLGWIVLDYLFVLISPLPFTLPLVQIWLAPYRGITYAGFYEHRMSRMTV